MINPDYIYCADQVKKKLTDNMFTMGSQKTFEEFNLFYPGQEDDNISIAVIASNPSMYTRARVVYKYIGMQGCRVSVQLGKQYEKIDFDIIKDFKFFVIEKIIDPRTLYHLKDLARSNHGAVIFDLDDLFYDLHPQHKLFYQYDPSKEESKRNIEAFEFTIKHCDHVFYSTRELMGHLEHLNPNCSLMPNFLDIEDRYSKATKRDWKSLAIKQGCYVDDETTILGFYGSESHTPDLENLGNVIHKILEQNPNTLIGICFGVDGIAHVCYHKWQIPYNKFVYFHVKNLKEFLNDVKCFDVGLAPLIHSNFNYSKTALKLMELNCLGIPYLCSKIANNHRYHIESGGVGGFECNSDEDWINYANLLLKDKDLREKIGQAGKDFVYKYHDVSRSFMPFMNTLRSIHHNTYKHLKTPHHFQLFDIYNNIPRAKTSYNEQDVCPCGSGDLYIDCKNDCYPAWGKVIKEEICQQNS